MPSRSILRPNGPSPIPTRTEGEFTNISAGTTVNSIRLSRSRAASMDHKVSVLEQKIGYTFQDKHIAQEALQLPGNGVEVIGTRCITAGNKRLAVLGDLVVDLVLSDAWYATEGDGRSWTNMRETVSCDANLAKVGRGLQLDGLLRQNPTNPQLASKKMVATLVEAVVGAVWIDSGRDMEVVKAVMSVMGLIANV